VSDGTWAMLLAFPACWFCLSVLACTLPSRFPTTGREQATNVVFFTVCLSVFTYVLLGIGWVWLNVGGWPAALLSVAPFLAVWLYWATRPDVRA
jgi:hypothetical protein